MSDAAATFDRAGLDGVVIPADEIHRVHLASLKDQFRAVQSTRRVLRVLA